MEDELEELNFMPSVDCFKGLCDQAKESYHTLANYICQWIVMEMLLSY